MYYNGIYHLFYHHNPKGVVWGNIIWAHSVSTDLINWISVEPAIYPSMPFDTNGCWFGSATVLPKTGPAMVYTGLDQNMRQVQNIAFPANLSDPYLRAWVKPSYNPLVEPSSGINVSRFRDPSTAWYKGGQWNMLVGGGTHSRKGVAYLYQSRDFKRWRKTKHPLHLAAKTGNWECPDFYAVSNDKYVLKVSIDEAHFDYYTVGTYDKRADKYVPDDPSLDGWKGLRYDYGSFYASKTFLEPNKGRRILWGWSNESDTKVMDTQKGWVGIQAVPRTVRLDPSGKQVIQWPIEEIQGMRQNHVQLTNHTLLKGDVLRINSITAAQADVEALFVLPERLEMAEVFEPGWANLSAQEVCAKKGSTVKGGIGPFGLLTLAFVGLEEYTPVFFRVFKAHHNKYVVLLCSDASRSSLISSPKMHKPSFGGFVDVDLKDRKLSLRSLIDHSVVESFGALGKTCVTSRVYPIKAVHHSAHLFAFNNGSAPVTLRNLDAWSMASPAMNRLAT